jgi:cobyrinic acid a,c-diamide synthase
VPGGMPILLMRLFLRSSYDGPNYMETRFELHRITEAAFTFPYHAPFQYFMNFGANISPFSSEVS